MNLSLGLSITTARAGGAVAQPVPISAVAADGWQATMITPTDLALSPVTVSRQGYDASGAATTHSETLYTTKRVREAYPNQAVLTSDAVALSGYLYAADTITDCTNNSTQVSPKPIARWSMFDRRVVANSISVSVVAFHINGIACVEFSATDGTNSITPVKVSSLTTTVDPLTGLAILEYVATLDVTALNDNANITVNAKVYPRFGVSASIHDSAANGSSPFGFTARTFRKNTSRAASPYIVLVKSTGNDATGAVDTSTSTSKNACLTLAGAITRAIAVLGSGTGALDGVEFRLDAGTWSRASSPSATVNNAAFVIKPIPGVAKASCVLEFGAANNWFNTPHQYITGLTIRRQGIYYLAYDDGVCMVDDCTFDWNGNTASPLAPSANIGTYSFRNVAFNAATSGIGLTGGTAMAIQMMRGCTGGAALSGAGVEMLCHIGNALSGIAYNNNKASEDNRVIAFNRFISIGNASSTIGMNTVTNLTGFANVQNVFEYCNAGGTANRTFMPSGDGAPTNLTHVLDWHNTYAGFDAYGRHNAFYDETEGTLRTHKFCSQIGVIGVQLNTKGDIFCGLNGRSSPGSHVGNWAFNYGVDCRGNLWRHRNASGTTGVGYEQDYPGIGSVVGTSNTGAGIDPLFDDPQHTTSGPTAGAGGGTYTIGAFSPAKGLVTSSPVPTDLAGNARSGTVAAGAYV